MKRLVPRSVFPFVLTLLATALPACDASSDASADGAGSDDASVATGLDDLSGTDAVPAADPRVVGWATGVVEAVAWGTDLLPEWQVPERALGPVTGDPADVVSLGNGGVLAVTFEPPIADGPGADFAVFENGVTDTFLELAWVEVSSDGVTFARFPARYDGDQPVSAYGGHDRALIHGFAGRYRVGFGTPFDLADLAAAPAVVGGAVDLAAVRLVRLVDVVGDGSRLDDAGHPIYDPTPTIESAGFDLDAVAVLHAAGR